MKKALFVISALLVAASAFAQVALSGDAKYAVIWAPYIAGYQKEAIVQNDDIRVYFDWKADDFTSGKITFRAQPLASSFFTTTSYSYVDSDNDGTYDKGESYNDSVGIVSTTTASKAMEFLDSASFATNLAGYFNLTGVTLKLSGGYCDLLSGKIASINNFQLSRIEYNLVKGLNTRIDVGIPMATLYYGIDWSTNAYTVGSAALMPMIAGVTGSIVGVQYEAAWAHISNANDVGNAMLQVKYGLRLPQKMILTVAAGGDMDLDGAYDTPVAGSWSNNLTSNDAYAIKYVAAARFSVPADLFGVAVDAGVDFNGSTEKIAAGDKNANIKKYGGNAGDQLWLANAASFDIKVTHDIVALNGGAVFDLNNSEGGSSTGAMGKGLVFWYAGLVKDFGKMNVRAGYAFHAQTTDIYGDSSDFRCSTADNNDNYADLKSLAAGQGGIYMSLYCKF
jgi:hypothetical protein